MWGPNISPRAEAGTGKPVTRQGRHRPLREEVLNKAATDQCADPRLKPRRLPPRHGAIRPIARGGREPRGTHLALQELTAPPLIGERVTVGGPHVRINAGGVGDVVILNVGAIVAGPQPCRVAVRHNVLHRQSAHQCKRLSERPLARWAYPK